MTDKEKEYIKIADLTRLRLVEKILMDCHCEDDPNKTRLRSIKSNVQLMVDDLFESIDIENLVYGEDP